MYFFYFYYRLNCCYCDETSLDNLTGLANAEKEEKTHKKKKVNSSSSNFVLVKKKKKRNMQNQLYTLKQLSN